jgi:type II secretory pathway pseudopilin PulG
MVELMVAIGLFSIITSIAVGGLVRALRTQSQLANLLSANSNMSLVLEQMSREIRAGYDFCTNGALCSTGNPKESLSFHNSKNQIVTYCLSRGRLMREVGSRACDEDSPQLTADNVQIAYANFFLSGDVSGDNIQPRVTVSLGVTYAQGQGAGTVVNIQTSVSPRPSDFN